MAGMFGGSVPQASTPQAPAPMPDPNSPGVMDAKRKAQMDIMARAGRSSTILTAPNTRGGTSDYSGTKLGAAA